METAELEKKLRSVIKKSDFTQSIDILKRYKLNGGNQSDAYAILETILASMRDKDTENTENTEDFIMDIMDIVSGFCLPEKKIW